VRGYGAAFNESWTPRFSTQIAVGFEKPEVCVGGSFLNIPCTPVKLTTHPIDLAGRYHFVNDTRWKPYLGGGLRYVRAPRLTSEVRAANRGDYSNHLDPQIVGGAEFLITPSIGVTVDGKQRIGTSAPYDPTFKVSAGLDLRF